MVGLRMIFSSYTFLTDPSLITSVMRWIASSMYYVDSSTFTPLDLESTCTKTLFFFFHVIYWFSGKANFQMFSHCLEDHFFTCTYPFPPLSGKFCPET